MKPISSWENISLFNQQPSKLTPGGKICIIKNVVDYPEKQYLRIEYDIAQGEEKNFFAKRYKNSSYTDKKWGGFFIRSYKDNALSLFKGFITAIEKSNPKFVWSWDERALINKLFGAVFGEEEYINYQGQKRIRPYISQVHSIDTIEKGDYQVPELKRFSPQNEEKKYTNVDLDELFKDNATTDSSDNNNDLIGLDDFLEDSPF